MPAHVKTSMMGMSLTVPISKGRLAMGTWQVRARTRGTERERACALWCFCMHDCIPSVPCCGQSTDERPGHAHRFLPFSLSVHLQGIWLNEHRDHGTPREVMITIQVGFMIAKCTVRGRYRRRVQEDSHPRSKCPLTRDLVFPLLPGLCAR